MVRIVLVSAVLVSVVGFLGGCDKKTELSFYNATARPVDVTVSAPPEGAGVIGTVGPHGKLNYTLKIKKDMLPAECSWSADGQGTPFTITKDSPKQLFFSVDDVFGPGGPRDKNTELHQKKQEDRGKEMVQQEEVVQ